MCQQKTLRPFECITWSVWIDLLTFALCVISNDQTYTYLPKMCRHNLVSDATKCLKLSPTLNRSGPRTKQSYLCLALVFRGRMLNYIEYCFDVYTAVYANTWLITFGWCSQWPLHYVCVSTDIRELNSSVDCYFFALVHSSQNRCWFASAVQMSPYSRYCQPGTRTQEVGPYLRVPVAITKINRPSLSPTTKGFIV